MSEDIRRKMRELEKQVEHHMHLYYDLDAPELEDYEYDRLIHSLMDLEVQYPQYASPNSPTKRVGGKAQNTFRGVTHKVQMGSLQDVFSTDELRAFDARCGRKCRTPPMWWSRRSTDFRFRWNTMMESWQWVLPAVMVLPGRM